MKNTVRPYIDLHLHSTASDGSLSPTEVVDAAAAIRITTLALTDHDTTAGLDEAEAAADRHGIEFIPGCELSSTTECGHVDFLGLWVPRENHAFEKKLSLLRSARGRRNRAILDKLAAMNINIDLQATADERAARARPASESGRGSLDGLGRPHIAMELFRRGYVSSVREAFTRYIGGDKPAFVMKEPFTPEEAVKFLSEAGAVTVLAHPMLIRAPEEWLEQLVAKLKPHGLDALEAYHSEHGNRGVRHILDLAGRYGFLVSGGSDFHGASKPGISIGKGKGNLRVPETILEPLKKRRQEKIRLLQTGTANS